MHLWSLLKEQKSVMDSSFPGSVNAMAFPHGYTAINHHLIGIMNDPVDDCFANSGITFISNAVVPAFWFKLCTENHRALHTTSVNGRT